MQFNIIFKTIFEYIYKKFCFVHTNTFCKYRKKLRASPRVHLVLVRKSLAVSIRVGVKYSTCTWYLYLSTYLSVLDVLEYLVSENIKVLVLVLVLDQKYLVLSWYFSSTIY